MASIASPVERGVPPIRAGKGHSFLLRRLHSLSGIIPVGAFLLEHFISNAFATNGPKAYADQVKFLTGLPFVPVLETVGICMPRSAGPAQSPSFTSSGTPTQCVSRGFIF